MPLAYLAPAVVASALALAAVASHIRALTARNGTVPGTGAPFNMNLQFKEPNPEILELYYGLWPYLG